MTILPCFRYNFTVDPPIIVQSLQRKTINTFVIMKMIPILFLSLFATLSPISGKGDRKIIAHSFDRAEQQYTGMLKAVPQPTAYPRTTEENGALRTTALNDWTEGFYPGSLWYIYENNQNPEWKKQAIRWTEALEPLKKQTGHHDIGFLIYCSFGNAYRLTGNDTYKHIIIEAANSLCTRFSPQTGCIKSWNYRKSWNGKDEWFYPVIIDNMMNLELLYFASKMTGDSRYANIANTHAQTTAREQFREDYSNYHVVNYDPKTGKALHKQTCQGFSDNSAWARGQAWAIYGYTMAYRETQNPEFLNMAQRTTEFWLNHPNLPKDKVPYWDFNAGQQGYVPEWDYDASRFKEVPRDASAAAITASALFELYKYVDKKTGARYYKAAVQTLQTLASPTYLAQAGTNANFLLKHCVGSIPHQNEIDVPLVYADYYFLEALHRYNNTLKEF